MSQELSILQIAAKAPDSPAHTFQLKNQNPNILYFRIANPVLQKFGKTRSIVKCVKFDKSHGYLIITNVPIKQDDEIIVLTIADFVKAVLEKLNEYLLYPNEYIDKISPYEKMEFLEPAEPSDYSDETLKALVFKRNSLLSSFTRMAQKI